MNKDIKRLEEKIDYLMKYLDIYHPTLPLKDYDFRIQAKACLYPRQPFQHTYEQYKINHIETVINNDLQRLIAEMEKTINIRLFGINI